MLTTPLPSEIDVRKLVVKGAEISAQVPISSLPRVSDLLAGEEGSLAVQLQFYIDDERFRRVDGHISGSVDVTCQRCLEPMPIAVDVEFELAIVWSEDDAERLPKTLDPLIVGEELIDLANVVSDELILSVPFVNYHPEEECEQAAGYSSVDPEVEATIAKAEQADSESAKPFEVLKNLKFDK